MLANTIGPLPKESDNPSEKVGKTSGYLDDMISVLDILHPVNSINSSSF